MAIDPTREQGADPMAEGDLEEAEPGASELEREEEVLEEEDDLAP